MYAPERQQAILGRARSDGRVDVNALADVFDVTPETIRRDLTGLERRGVLRRVHGGAIPVERLSIELAVDERYGVNAVQKERIAKAALDQLPDGGSIIIDAGTTTVRFAEMLPTDRSFTVVTHALPIAAMLAGRSNITLHLVGGQVRPGTLAAVGSWAERDLAGIFADVAFVGTQRHQSGARPDHAGRRGGRRQAGADAVRPTHRRARRPQQVRPRRVCPVADLSEVDTIITDSEVDADMAREIEDAGPEVIRA